MLYANTRKLHFRHIVNKLRDKYLSWTLLYLSLMLYSWKPNCGTGQRVRNTNTFCHNCAVHKVRSTFFLPEKSAAGQNPTA